MSKKKNSDLSVVGILGEDETLENETSDASGIILMTEPDSISRDGMDVIINSERNKIIDTMENEDLFSTDMVDEDEDEDVSLSEQTFIELTIMSSSTLISSSASIASSNFSHSDGVSLRPIRPPSKIS